MQYTHRQAEDESMRRLQQMEVKKQEVLASRNQPATGEDFFTTYATLFGLDQNDPNKDFLKKFEVLDSSTDEGGILARSPSTGHTLHFHGGGVQGDVMEEERLTDKGLEAQIELALAAKSLPSAKNGLAFHGSEQASLIAEKAASMVGLKLLNPAEGDLDAATAKRMEQIWERMKQERPELAKLDAAAPAQGQDNAVNKPAVGLPAGP